MIKTMSRNLNNTNILVIYVVVAKWNQRYEKEICDLVKNIVNDKCFNVMNLYEHYIL